MNLRIECPERYPDNVTGVAWRYPDDVTTGTKHGKSTCPRLETRLKGALYEIIMKLRNTYLCRNTKYFFHNRIFNFRCDFLKFSSA